MCSCRGSACSWSRRRTCRDGSSGVSATGAGPRSCPAARGTRSRIPCDRNYRHVRAVEAALRAVAPVGSVRSVMAFVGDAQLKTAMPENVTVGMGFARYVRSFNRPVMSDGDVGAACQSLASVRLRGSRTTRREHVRALRSRADPMAVRKCPRCGRDMVLRTTRQGRHAGRRFWGCSGFPWCRMTIDAIGKRTTAVD